MRWQAVSLFAISSLICACGEEDDAAGSTTGTGGFESSGFDGGSSGGLDTTGSDGETGSGEAAGDASGGEDSASDAGDGDSGVDAGSQSSGETSGETSGGEASVGTESAGEESGGEVEGGDGDGAGEAASTGAGDGDASASGASAEDSGVPSTASGGDGDGDEGGGSSGDGDGDGCEAPAEHLSCDSPGSNPSPLQALGLDCPGEPWQMTPTVANSFNSPDSSAWTIARQFGTSGDWTAREGEQMLVLTTADVSGPDGGGTVNMGNNHYPGFTGDNGNPDMSSLPDPIRAQNGGAGGAFSNCDGVNDCSNSLQAQWQLGGGDARDVLWFDFTVDVPGGTHGWTMDFNFFTAEYPNYVDTNFNDIFVVWSTNEAYVGNTCFVGPDPCTVTGLDDAIEDAGNGGALPGSSKMSGTGMTGSEGGASGWYQISGATTPDSSLELTFALFDMGDPYWNTVVAIDNWRWDCEGCDPTIPDDCGVTPVPQ